MPFLRQPSLLAVFVLAAFLSAAAVARPDAASFARPAAQDPDPSPCTVDARSIAAPETVGLGETVAMTLAARTTCPDADLGPLNIVFVMQASSQMARDPDTGEHPRAEMQAAARAMLERLDLAANPWIKVGIVEYSDRPNRLCALTSDPAELEACLMSLRASGMRNVAAAIDEGGNILSRGRRGAPEDLAEAMFIFGDMNHELADPRTRVPDSVVSGLLPLQSSCDAPAEEADALKAERPELLVASVCVGGCDIACARQLATSAGFVFNTDSLEPLLTRLDQIVVQARGNPVKELRAQVELAPNMAYIADSASPPAEVSDGAVSWRITGASAVDTVLRLRVEPLEVGNGPLCTMASGVAVDAAGREAAFEFGCPVVSVEAGVPTPSATPTATAVPATSETPMPSPTPTLPPTDPPEVRGVYLPLGLADAPLSVER